MSEAIGEMILPGTYIEVRAEGLIGVVGIATGNIGVVGTASKGPLDKVVILGSYAEALDTFGSYDRWPGGEDGPLSLTRTLEQIFKGGGSTVYAVRVAALATGETMKSRTFTLQDKDANDVVTLTATSPGTWANAIKATADATTLTLELGRAKEEFPLGGKASELVAAINDGSRFVTAAVVAGADPAETAANADSVPKTVKPGTAADNGGPDGTAASKDELRAGLGLLAMEDVNIVVAAGFDAAGAAGTMLAHLEATENDGRERIGVMGASTDKIDKIISDDVSKASNARLILVAPGIVADDAARTGEKDKSVKLPASYAAALVAGRLATLAPHISLTNKDVAADDLTASYTRAEQKQLLNNRVMVLQKNLGIRALKGITTDTGPFRQISVRRIVDYAKKGVRLGSNPYIGRLNNARVRSALKATLDGFLSSMVLDEMLIAYTLNVTATRAEEINGQAVVTMTLQPTFSIDFVKVIMTLS